MIFEETELKGAYLIKPEKHLDERGFFTRTFCKKEFEQHGLNSQVAQCNTSYNKVKGTFRGMHYQAAPHAENKMVSCGRGAIWDVIVDLRTDSPSYRKWIGVELSEENRTILYVPEGFDSNVLVEHAFNTYNISFGIGLGEMNGKAFRIGHLGALTDVMVLSGVATIEMAMKDLNYPIELGSGVAAAQEYFRNSASS